MRIRLLEDYGEHKAGAELELSRSLAWVLVGRGAAVPASDTPKGAEKK